MSGSTQLTSAPTSAKGRAQTAAAKPFPICTTPRPCSNDISLNDALLVEPDVVEAPTVEDAVDHYGDPMHPRVMAGPEAGLIKGPGGPGLPQAPGGYPGQVLATFPGWLYR